MDIENIKEIFNTGLDMITSANCYQSVVNMKNNLYKLDTINRILVYAQNQNAFDVKTALEWSVLNRDIQKKQTPIYLILPIYDTKYIDTESGNNVNIDDLSIDELNKALEYNILAKNENIKSTDIVSYFDIRQTKSVNNIEYNVDKPIVSSGKLLSILKDITECSIEESEMDYYSESEKTVFISKKPYNKLLKTISDILYKYYINNLHKDEIIDTSDFSDYDNELLEITIKYSIETLFGSEESVSFDIIRHVSKDRLIDILNINNIIIVDIAARIETTNGVNNADAYHNLVITRKAEALLNIMEANNIYKIMKGV